MRQITAYRDTDVVTKKYRSLNQENDRLRLENRIPNEETDILKSSRLTIDPVYRL